MTYIPPKQCAICQAIFTPQKRPHGTVTATCGRRSCAAKLGARQDSYRVGLARAAATLKAKRAARIAAKTAHQFGALTDRETAIFTAGSREGYMDGWNRAVQAERKKRQRQGYVA